MPCIKLRSVSGTGVLKWDELLSQISLIVKDNRLAFYNTDFKTLKSLVLQLANVLTNQLEEIIELDSRFGIELKITFSELAL